MSADVFISYASEDYDAACTIRDDLEADNILCWMASRDIPGSEDYAAVIPPAIETAGVFLILLSAAALASDHVSSEAHLAKDAKKPILPIRVEGIKRVEGSLRYPLAGRQWIDATPRVEPALGRIRKEVRRLLVGSGKPVRRSSRPTAVHRAATSLAAWLLVGTMTVLTLRVMQGYWINLVPWWKVPVAAALHPLPLGIMLALPVTALIVQFYAHRRMRSIFTLDALFTIAPVRTTRKSGDQDDIAGQSRPWMAGAGLMRTSGVLCVSVLLYWTGSGPPATITVTKRTDAAAPQERSIKVSQNCQTDSYTESMGAYEATVRVGRFNPPGVYLFTLEVDFKDPDAVNFCRVWPSEKLRVQDRELQVNWRDTVEAVGTVAVQRRYVQISRPRDVFLGESRVSFTLVHPTGETPKHGVTVHATAVHAHHSVQSNHVAINEADWPDRR